MKQYKSKEKTLIANSKNSTIPIHIGSKYCSTQLTRKHPIQEKSIAIVIFSNKIHKGCLLSYFTILFCHGDPMICQKSYRHISLLIPQMFAKSSYIRIIYFVISILTSTWIPLHPHWLIHGFITDRHIITLCLFQ